MQDNFPKDEERDVAGESAASKSTDVNAQDTATLIDSNLLGGDIIGSETNENNSFPADSEVKIIEGGITDVTGTVALGGSSDVGGTGEPAATADVGATTGAAGLDPIAIGPDTGSTTDDDDGGGLLI